MFNKTGIAENVIMSYDRLNLLDYLIIGRWDYALGSISCLFLLFGIAQTCYTSKLAYIIVLLGLLLIAAISYMAENFYVNWNNFYKYSTRSDSSYFERLNPINDADYDNNSASVCKGIGYFCYYTA